MSAFDDVLTDAVAKGKLMDKEMTVEMATELRKKGYEDYLHFLLKQPKPDTLGEIFDLGDTMLWLKERIKAWPNDL